MDYLQDTNFLKQLDLDRNKKTYVRIIVLDNDERPISTIEGRVTGGSISVDGSSSVQRTCNLTFIPDDDSLSFTDINNLLSINKRIRIDKGIENNVNPKYEKKIWIKEGIFIITNPAISHTSTGLSVTLSCKDKMCLLNGDCGGTLPTSVTFHEYDQIIGYLECDELPTVNQKTNFIYNNNGTYYEWESSIGYYKIEASAARSLIGQRISIKQRVYDIILTAVCNYGHEDISNILISDVPIQLKQIVRYVGNDVLYYDPSGAEYKLASSGVTPDTNWRVFKYNDDVGYIYTDFVYPGELITNIGDSVTSVLDSICNALGNFEYFYDRDGHFVFREKKNYLNRTYDATSEYRLDNAGKEIRVDNQIQYLALADNYLYILDDASYKVDYSNNTRLAYEFGEDYNLAFSYSNNPNYLNIKNDYHMWGKNEDGFGIHYHLAFKKKPTQKNKYNVVFLKDDKDNYTGGLRLAEEGEAYSVYEPEDWRAEMYLQGLSKQQRQVRPDIYEQELIDLFDMIYDFKEKRFKADIIKSPNELVYFLDFIEPVDAISDYSVDTIGQRTLTQQYDKIIRLFDVEIPNVIIINSNESDAKNAAIRARCQIENTPFSNVTSDIYAQLAIGTVGYSAEEKVRDLLYQHTNFTESVSLTVPPIYYLEPNTRVNIKDNKADINGEYIIRSFNIPLDGRSNMTISAIRALDRI